MNSDTFASFSAAYPSGHPFALPAAFTTTSSTETQFLLSNGNAAVITVPVGTEILGAQTPFSPNANPAYIAESGRAGKWMGETRPFFNSSSFNNRAFKLKAYGYIAGGGTTLTSISATVAVYAAITQVTTVTSGTKIASIAITGGIGNVKANWMIEMPMLWDSVSQELNGTRNVMVGVPGLVTAANAANTTVASLALTSLNFGITWIFATTSTANTVGLTELSLEQA